MVEIAERVDVRSVAMAVSLSEQSGSAEDTSAVKENGLSFLIILITTSDS